MEKSRIKVLDEKVINRIAAGEVVERPVSVVKELVENSVDAQASHIRVEIENGGKKLIRVVDNGVGISHDDAFLALERHATSKLSTEKDLVGIATLGFRGEALASIGSISRLRLMTREADDPSGTEIVVEAGVIRRSAQIGMAAGTVVEVNNLFYNVPVRRKFLKSRDVETSHVHELITRLALAFPSVGFTYLEDGRVRLDAPEVKSTFERIYTLYSKDVRENLVEVDHRLEAGTLTGYVARPPYARSNMRSVLTFVNGRCVRDRLVNSAVTRAFSNLMERGRYPLAILFIELPPHELDVNVHPQKAEVRFVKPEQIFNLILDGVHQALMGAPFNPPSRVREPVFPSAPYAQVSRHVQDERPAADNAHGSHPSPPTPETHISAPLPPQAPNRTGPFSNLGVLGQIPGSFLVLFNSEDLVVLDQHAAHERVLFEALVRSDREGRRLESQVLLIPRILEYSPVEARGLASHLDLLRNAGFRIEEFGEQDFVVKAVPAWLKSDDLEGLFSELIEVMLNTGLNGDPNRLKEEMLRSMACRAAVKESKQMQPEEIRNLLSQLDRSSAPEVCPHGRPMTVRFPLSEIRRRLGRK